jgi:hypothetical protein
MPENSSENKNITEKNIVHDDEDILCHKYRLIMSKSINRILLSTKLCISGAS